jgi:hypothetical protein
MWQGARTETNEGFSYELAAKLPKLARKRPFTSNGKRWAVNESSA